MKHEKIMNLLNETNNSKFEKENGTLSMTMKCKLWCRKLNFV